MIVFLVGASSVGKSTLAEHFCSKHEGFIHKRLDRCAIDIAEDRFKTKNIEDFPGYTDEEKWKQFWKLCAECIKAYDEEFEKSENVCIIDVGAGALQTDLGRCFFDKNPRAVLISAPYREIYDRDKLNEKRNHRQYYETEFSPDRTRLYNSIPHKIDIKGLDLEAAKKKFDEKFPEIVKRLRCEAPIYKFSIPFKFIKTLPDNERVAFVYLSRALNEINMLYKLTFMFAKRLQYEIDETAQETQKFFFFVLLIGKLFETWELLKKVFFLGPSKEYEKYLADISEISDNQKKIFIEEAREGLDKLKKYFGKENVINKIRNEAAFHYNPDLMERVLKKFRDNDKFDIYLPHSQVNALYQTPNIIFKACIIDLVNIDNNLTTKETWEKINLEVQEITSYFITFLGHYLGFLVEKKINFNKWEKKDLRIPLVKPQDCYLPYFFDRFCDDD